MPAPELLRTALHDWHQNHGARLVEFGGWSMPVQYSSILQEHAAVRDQLGLFDIGHMGRLLFGGPDAATWIDRATTNAVGRLEPGHIQYSLMVNDDGGVLDDVLVYRLFGAGAGDSVTATSDYAVVCNASNRGAVLARFEELRGGLNAVMADTTTETAMIAVQGPAAVEVLGQVVESDGPLMAVSYYHCAPVRVQGVEGLASRTGYTGEDGFELVVPGAMAEPLWTALLEAGRDQGARPCGLGARDTLRFEAGMPLYGHELSETINPYEAGLGWAVKLNKGEFVGREALRRLKGESGRRRVGLALEGKRIARQGYTVRRGGTPTGVVTSGTFAPSLDRSLAMALVDRGAEAIGTRLEVDVRGQDVPAEVVPLPFYRRDRRLTSDLKNDE